MPDLPGGSLFGCRGEWTSNPKALRNDDDDEAQDLEQDLSQEHYAPRTVLECTGVESSVCTAAYAV